MKSNSRLGYAMKLPVAEIILGSFVFFTAPVIALVALQGLESNYFNWIMNYFYVCLGMSHFFVTFAVYCNSANLQYFFSDWKNVIAYIATPLAILCGFFCYYQFEVKQMYPFAPLLGPIVMLVVRVFDFLHVQRQSYGVLQLIKASARLDYRQSGREFEQLFFPLMAAACWITYAKTFRYSDMSGKLALAETDFYQTLVALPLQEVILACCAPLFLVALVRLLSLKDSDAPLRTRYAPVLYFLFQSTAVSLAVIDTRFYVMGLAMHYTEYHILMYRRSFSAEGSFFNSRHSTRLRRWCLTVGFYVALMTVTVMFGFNKEFFSRNLVLSSMDNVFMGIVILHFYVESLIWRFRNEHFRENLGPVYFGSD